MNRLPLTDRRWLFLAGFAAAAFATMLVGLFGPHGASLGGVPRELQTRVEQALEAQSVRNVSVEMDGQTAHLIGASPSEEGRLLAIQTALTAAGPGGAWAGGVSAVESADLVVGAPVSPYTWRIARRGNQLTLSGHAPTARAKEHLLTEASNAFAGAEIVDQMRIAPGAPNQAWTGVASDAIGQLAKLRQGEARMSDGLLILIGDGGANAVDAVSAHYRALLPPPYHARVEATVTGEGLNFADLGDLNLADAGAEACQAAFGRMMERNVISFATASSEIDRSSLRLLGQLASIALRCDAFTIEIAGHTDNVGPRAPNMALSQRRASSVASYLVGQGVSRERLRAIGYGPDRPRRSNETPVGQSANRRIEFTVSE